MHPISASWLIQFLLDFWLFISTKYVSYGFYEFVPSYLLQHGFLQTGFCTYTSVISVFKLDVFFRKFLQRVSCDWTHSEIKVANVMLVP